MLTYSYKYVAWTFVLGIRVTMRGNFHPNDGINVTGSYYCFRRAGAIGLNSRWMGAKGCVNHYPNHLRGHDGWCTSI